MQRRLVDDAISDKINNWMDRYLMVCSSGDSAYHVLVGKLLHGIVRLQPRNQARFVNIIHDSAAVVEGGSRLPIRSNIFICRGSTQRRISFVNGRMPLDPVAQ